MIAIQGHMRAEACLLVDVDAQAISSTPQAWGLVSLIPPKRAGCECLPGWRGAFELVAEILEVIRADA
jgi:hypothetical protein